MRRIKITTNLIDKLESFYEDLFESREFKSPIDNLTSLLKKRGFNSGENKKYIELLIKEYDNIQIAKPDEIVGYCEKFDRIKNHKKLNKSFWERIVGELRYDALREKEYIELAQDLELKSCFYCNAQLSVIADVEFYKNPRKLKKRKKGDVKKRIATFELDHWKPKSKYPFLATSFFNLIPSCSYCNKAKSANEIEIEWYTEDDNLDIFEFELNKQSEQDYSESNKRDDLKFIFQHVQQDTVFLEKYDKTFHISGIYKTQLDLIEDLIWRRDHFDKIFKKDLKSLANGFIFPSNEILDRLIIGNYAKPEDIHKRPLSKFTQDIADDLGLLKKLE